MLICKLGTEQLDRSSQVLNLELKLELFLSISRVARLVARLDHGSNDGSAVVNYSE